MWNWISENSSAIAAVTSVGTLLVWLVYLQLILSNFRRQRRSTILINRGAGSGLGGHCLISNMSTSAVYLTSIIATMKTEDRTFQHALTDLRELDETMKGDPRSIFKQGPLQPGEYLDIGTFRDLIQQMGESEDGPAQGEDWASVVESLELTAVAVYGSDDLLVGSRRTFELRKDEDGRTSVCPTTLDSVQIRSRRERRKIGALLQESL
ncbi:hypothetical protein [Afifella sp. IM 167]|uniref:hypothetical protein n=1 Tax=Afifella sp. IM 167 TaxID=2033586 RepID=UPI001CCD7DB8|nr:hypothetical protein [Afifella sp. IM 167]MBZ8134178.1 hypothetical protein [Afifella sp. IM 167]